MRNVPWLSNLKLRVGYGLTGSTAISPYQTLDTFGIENAVIDGKIVVGYSTGESFKGSLKWETTSQTNIGLDASFFKNRLNFTVDGYYKKTTDMLNDVDMPRSSGYTKGVANIGSMQNAGIEISADGRIIDSAVKWDAGINFSLNRSKVLSLANGNDVFGSIINNTIINDYLNLVRVGEPMYVFYGYVEDGYDDEGRIKYKDFDGVEGISANDKTIIGNPNPDFMLNFNTSVSYRNFTLSAFLQGVFGADLFALGMATIAYDYAENKNFLADVSDNYWTPERTDAKYPNIWDVTSYKISDRWVYDASYLRLKNLELSYDVPFKKPKIAVRVYVSGQNLFTITKYPMWDPDVNSKGGGSSLTQGIDNMAYPHARSYTLGVRIKF